MPGIWGLKRAAIRKWGKGRKSIKNFSQILIKKKDEIAELITKEMGKPIIESEGEVDEIPGLVEWFLKETKGIIQDENIKLDVDNASAKVRFEPIGVVGLITPWNLEIKKRRSLHQKSTCY